MSGREVTFVVPGEAVPQGSKKAFVQGRRAVIVDVKSTELKAWRAQIASHAAIAYADAPIENAVDVRLEFRVLRPASVSERKRPFPSVAPDIDKLARAVLDALTGSVIKDDSLVVDLRASKRYAAQPSVLIRVRETEKREEQ